MTTGDPTSVAIRFNDHINDRDLGGLASLMTDDHVFVDPDGAAVSGRAACIDAWRGFFAAFPDYRNVFASLTANGDTVTITGHSVCTEPALAGPAVWTATIRGGSVARWQVQDTVDA